MLVTWMANAGQGALIWPSLLLVPFIIGFVAAWCWRHLDLGPGPTIGCSSVTAFIGLFGAWLVFREGMICLLIVAPLQFLITITGSLTARVLFKKSGPLCAFSLPVIFLVGVLEPRIAGPSSGVVTDTLVIHASPAQVWPHVLAFGPITEPPGFWMFRMGLPYPESTTNTGDAVGASRACNFSGNAVFEERIVEFEPQRLLTFDIVKAPPDPELLGHLDAHRGQFELIANPDGTTTLIGRTWYTLHVRPGWYFDPWTELIFREVHLRVMRHVRGLAELQR